MIDVNEVAASLQDVADAALVVADALDKSAKAFQASAVALLQRVAR